MKNFILFLAIVLCSGVLKAQYIYNDSGNAICTVQEDAFYRGGNKLVFVKNNIVYNASGVKIGSMLEKFLYDDAGNIICTLEGKALYSGGNKVAFVRNDVVYDGRGNRIVAVKGISLMQIAVFLFFIAR